MATFTLTGRSFDVSEKSRDFLESYIKRIRTYIDANAISETYLDDLLDRIVEKLEKIEKKETPLPDAAVIKVVNEIGEPEDIFAEGVKTIVEKPKNKIKEEHYLKKDPDNGIIFGVCAGMSAYFGVNVLWIRLLFIFVMFFFGTGFLVYIVLALLLPKANSSSSSPIIVEGRGLITNLSGYVGTGFRGVFRLFLAVVFALIGLMSFGFFMAGVVASGFLISGGIVAGNQMFPAIVPEMLTIGVSILTFVALLISASLFSAILGKNLIGRSGWTGLFILFATGAICVTTGGFTLFQEYTWSAYTSREQSFDYTGVTLDISDDMNNMRSEGMEIAHIWSQIHVRREANRQNITIKTNEYIQTKDEPTSKSILASMNLPTYSYSGGVLRIERYDGPDFQKVVPFSFPRRRIEILIPEGVTLIGEYAYLNPNNEKDEENGYERYDN